MLYMELRGTAGWCWVISFLHHIVNIACRTHPIACASSVLLQVLRCATTRARMVSRPGCVVGNRSVGCGRQRVASESFSQRVTQTESAQPKCKLVRYFAASLYRRCVCRGDLLLAAALLRQSLPLASRPTFDSGVDAQVRGKLPLSLSAKAFRGKGLEL